MKPINSISYLAIPYLAVNLIFSGCGKAVSSLDQHKPDNTHVAPIQMGNNSAIVSGGPIGKNTTAISNLRKAINVNVVGDPLNIGIGDVYAARANTSSNLTYFMFTATNNSNRTLCFIKLNGIIYKNPVGTVLAPSSPQTPAVDYAYVFGSVKTVLAGLSVHTCLAPKETGMLLNVDEIPFTSVASMEFSFTSTASGFEPSAKVIPIDYLPASTLKISVKNLGTETALIDSASHYHVWSLLDSEKKPLLFGYIETTSQSAIAPNVIATLTSAVDYDGTGSSLRVFVDFDDVTPGLQKTTVDTSHDQSCAPGLPMDEFQLCMIKRQNIWQNLIETTARR